MSLTRRDLLKTGAMAGAALFANRPVAEATQPAKSTQPIRIGVSTYSYWHFDKVKYPIEKVIENAARIGFDGVEIKRSIRPDLARRRVQRLRLAGDGSQRRG